MLLVGECALGGMLAPPGQVERGHAAAADRDTQPDLQRVQSPLVPGSTAVGSPARSSCRCAQIAWAMRYSAVAYAAS
jgi:hypothetical protein